ncbi:hypothetical protein CDC09_16835 [Pseudomonas aeruginosa]|nr:hypothetical protein CDC09_16835 [Pseudomonas aeruginosa]
MTMYRVYLDTEFTTLNRYRVQLISLVLVVPEVPEFYVELTDAWTLADCSPFVITTVLLRSGFTFTRRYGLWKFWAK